MWHPLRTLFPKFSKREESMTITMIFSSQKHFNIYFKQRIQILPEKKNHI